MCTGVTWCIEPLNVFVQTRLDDVVVQKLRKGDKTLAEVLIGEIDGGIHNANATEKKKI